ncbi:MAG: response regulator [Myxococcales bacterium]
MSRNILIVGDEPQMRKIVKGQLTRRPWNVTEAACCREAEAILSEKNTFEVILCDLNLPDGMAWQLLDQSSERTDQPVSVKEENGLVVYRFVDSGPGLTPDVADKVFDPFFTTKPTGKGTGLGLSLSHGIVEKHGGSIQCKPKSALGGAEFVVRIPRGDFA